MSCYKFVSEFLKQMEEAWPPIGSWKNHHICLLHCQYGSSETSWENKLALQVPVGEYWQAFFLEEADFEKPIEALVTEIVEILKQPDPLRLQTSRQVGTFNR